MICFLTLIASLELHGQILRVETVLTKTMFCISAKLLFTGKYFNVLFCYFIIPSAATIIGTIFEFIYHISLFRFTAHYTFIVFLIIWLL